MAIVIKPITLEVSKPNVFQAIAAKQNDSNSRFLQVTITNEGEMIYILPTSTVTINAKRNDGESNSFFGEANDDGTATVPIHSWILEIAGYVNCDVSIIDKDERKLTTTSFTLLVEEASHNSDDISEEEQYDFIAEVMSRIPVVDQEFDKESANAQSGFAVAEATKPLNNIFANALKGSKSGEVISVSDVSPIEHNLSVKLSSDTITDFSSVNVTRYGKNLCDKNYLAEKSNWSMLNNSYYSIPIYVGKGVTVTISYQQTLSLGLGMYAAVMTQNTTADALTSWIYHNTVLGYINKSVTLTTTEDYIYLRISATTSNIATKVAQFMEYIGNDMQIEVGSVATEYEEYQQPRTVTANADGTVEGFVSMNPSMTFETDTDGVNINLNYNRDINIAFAQIEQAILNNA